ncbi:uncharacterized protein METZ01_LOCUS300152, partial [marine metagenome]
GVSGDVRSSLQNSFAAYDQLAQSLGAWYHNPPEWYAEPPWYAWNYLPPSTGNPLAGWYSTDQMGTEWWHGGGGQMPTDQLLGPEHDNIEWIHGSNVSTGSIQDYYEQVYAAQLAQLGWSTGFGLPIVGGEGSFYGPGSYDWEMPYQVPEFTMPWGPPIF